MQEKDDQAFATLMRQARAEIKNHPEFLQEEWQWVHELEDEGFFIFCYLVEDFNKKVLSRKEIEETVYTLLMMRYKLLPPHLQKVRKVPLQWQMQLLFNLYERLKKEDMNWEACEAFVQEHMEKLPMTKDN